MRSRRVFSALFKRAISLLALICIWVELNPLSAHPVWAALGRYGVLVGLLCFVYFAVDEYMELLRGKSWWQMAKGALTLAAVGMGFVSYFLLHRTPTLRSTEQLLCYLLPALVLLDWLLFDKKGSYRPTDPLVWVVLPNVYFLVMTVRGFCLPVGTAARFPYGFMNYDVLGVGTVLLYWLGLNLGALCLGYLFWLLDRFLGGKRHR